jgi:hypothetical protein
VLEAEIAKVRAGGTALTEADLLRVSKSNEVMGRMRQLHQHIVARERGKQAQAQADRSGGCPGLGQRWRRLCACWLGLGGLAQAAA